MSVEKINSIWKFAVNSTVMIDFWIITNQPRQLKQITSKNNAAGDNMKIKKYYITQDPKIDNCQEFMCYIKVGTVLFK